MSETAEERRNRHRAQYHDRRARKVCVRCEARTTKAYCNRCRDKTKESHARSQAKRKRRLYEAGVCMSCGKRPPAPGISLCERCRGVNNRASRRWKASADRTKLAAQQRTRAWEMRSLGICVRCGSGRIAPHSFMCCQTCLDKQAALRRKLRREAAGRGDCPKCYKPKDHSRDGWCTRCLEKNKEWKARKRAADNHRPTLTSTEAV